jgi:DNA-binding LacI/PurR family transcriptional regulator
LHIGSATAEAETHGDPTCQGFMEDLENDHVSGVLAVATAPRASLVDPLKARGIPIVGMDSLGTFDGSVCMDYGGMLRLGAESLISQGCRKLAMVGGIYQKHETGRILDDFEQTILRRGLRYRREWSRIVIHPGRRGAGWEDFRELWSAQREKPDGLLVADDMMLADVALAIHELGIEVPRQLKVVLATSQGMPHHAPFPLRRIENIPETMAEKMMGLLTDLMAGRVPRECDLTVGYSESNNRQRVILREHL